MAMEKLYTVRDTHTRSLTALGINPSRREILIGCEDGAVKSYEADTGRMVHYYSEHAGWVTDFIYWAEPKIVFSSSNDCAIVAYGSGGGISDKITVSEPVYCMAINLRRNEILLGMNASIHVYNLDEERRDGHFIVSQLIHVSKEHTDIVRCILCVDSKVYSAGYDQRLIIYDSSYSKCMEPCNLNDPPAHDAGICSLLHIKDNENNIWVVTGSFDKTAKIWSPDGSLVHTLKGFLSTVTGTCYVPRDKTIWAAGGTSYAYMFDPKSGENVSDFIGTFQQQEEEKYHLLQLRFYPETNMVATSTSRRHLIVWKYNPSGCITALKCRTGIESLTYTTKVPILIFSGDLDGSIIKWERMQSNHFMYSKEFMHLQDGKKAKVKDSKRPKAIEAKKASSAAQPVPSTTKKAKNITSHYAYNKPMIPPATVHKHPNTSLLKMIFLEEMDLIVAGCEDGSIYIWGFDEDAVKALKTMEPDDTEKTLIRRYAILLGKDSELVQQYYGVQDEDSVTNRVAGFICKHILKEHTDAVTSLAVVGRQHGFGTTYLVSGGWDRRICIWNLETGSLSDVFRNRTLSANMEHYEVACDGVITDLVYCPKRNEVAYSSTDKMVYLRRFTPRGSEMLMINTLQGHFAEVTCVCWNEAKSKWITGSEDGTIRIWSGDGMNECEQVLSAQGSVMSMCLDRVNGAIVAGVEEYIRVYDPVHYRLVQQNVGHSDAVKQVIHIPERNQYVSCSADRSIRIWNAWKMPKPKKTLFTANKSSSDVTQNSSNTGVAGKKKSSDDMKQDSMGVIIEADEIEVGEEATSMKHKKRS